MPRVAFTRTGSTDFVGHLVGMNTIGGQLVWQGTATDFDGTGSLSLPPSGLRVCAPGACEGQGEYVFAVTDWNGNAVPGFFFYDVTVTLP